MGDGFWATGLVADVATTERAARDVIAAIETALRGPAMWEESLRGEIAGLIDEPDDTGASRVLSLRAVAAAFVAAHTARWVEAEWFAENAVRMGGSVEQGDAGAPVWYAAMGVAVMAEWHTGAGTSRFEAVRESMARGRASNRLSSWHAIALGGIGHVLAGRGSRGEAAVSLRRALSLLPADADALRALLCAELAFIEYRRGDWDAAASLTREATTAAAIANSPLAASTATEVRALGDLLRGDLEGWRQRSRTREQPTLSAQWGPVADLIAGYSGVVAVFSSQEWTRLQVAVEATERRGYRGALTPHELRGLRGVALWGTRRLAPYRALLADWSTLQGALASPYYWMHRALLALLEHRPETAASASAAAQESITGAEDPLGRCQVLVVLGTASCTTGAVMAGKELYEQARLELQNLGATRLEELCTMITKRTVDAVIGSGDSALSLLTPQQQRVCELVADGYTSAETAAILHLSKKTVDFHVANAVTRLKVSNRRELVRRINEDSAHTRELRIAEQET